MTQNRLEAKKYTPKVFSALKTQVPQQGKRGLVHTKKLVFKGKRRKIRIHQRALKVFVGGPLRAALVYRFWPPNRGLKEVEFVGRDLNCEHGHYHACELAVGLVHGSVGLSYPFPQCLGSLGFEPHVAGEHFSNGQQKLVVISATQSRAGSWPDGRC